LDRIRAIFDASFFEVNSQVSESFATQESNRELLRVSNSIVMAAGSGTLPGNTLKKYIEDATFTVSATPTKRYSFRRYPQYLRANDSRLGYWTTIGETILAKTPAPVTNLTATATFSSICSPAIPATEDDLFVAPDDYISDFNAGFVQFILGQTADTAAITA
jgi:hypothetical protein